MQLMSGDRLVGPSTDPRIDDVVQAALAETLDKAPRSPLAGAWVLLPRPAITRDASKARRAMTMGERPRLDCEPRAEPTAERMIWSRKLIVNSLGTAGTTLMLQVGCLLLSRLELCLAVPRFNRWGSCRTILAGIWTDLDGNDVAMLKARVA